MKGLSASVMWDFISGEYDKLLTEHGIVMRQGYE